MSTEDNGSSGKTDPTQHDHDHDLTLGVHHAFIYWVVVASLVMIVGVLFKPQEFTQPVSEYSYALFNRFFGHAAYEPRNDDDIGVVLLNQESLADFEASWPPVFALHARVLGGLLVERPAAVFLDFTLRDRRSDPVGNVEQRELAQEEAHPVDLRYVMRDETLPELVRVLKKYHALGIPIYVASGLEERFGFIEILPELKEYVTLVSGWGHARSQADIRAINYDLVRQSPKSGSAATAWTAEAAKSATLSPALQIYGDLCLRKKKDPNLDLNGNWNCPEDIFQREQEIENGEPKDGLPEALIERAFERNMNLIWADQSPAYAGWPEGSGNMTAGRQFNCFEDQHKDFSFPISIFWRAYDFVFDAPKGNYCGPFDTLQASHVVYGTPDLSDSWRSRFSGRIVFYGFDLQGFQDVIRPPTLETDIAGVFKHATALENLLTFGPDYLSDTGRYRGYAFVPWWIEFCTLMTVFAVRFLFLIYIKSKTEVWLEQHFRPVPRPRRRTRTVGDIAAHVSRRSRELVAKSVFLLRTKKGQNHPDDPPSSHVGVKIVGILILEFLVVAAIVWFATYWIEMRLLHIAPANWLTIIGFLFVSYPSYLRYIVIEERKELDQAGKHSI